MTSFAQVQSVSFGCNTLLREMHRDLMRQMWTAQTPGEREEAAERASRVREWMTQMDMARLITGAARW